MNAQHLILPSFNEKTVEDKVYLESKFDKNCVIILMDQVKSHDNGKYLLSNCKTGNLQSWMPHYTLLD